MNLVPFMEQWHMLPPPGGTVLVAVSGGRDSMCLLHYLHALGRERDFTVAAGHLNHAMRPEADSDEAFVRDFCRRLDIPFYTQKLPVYEMAAAWGLTVEETGRRARYDFLEQTADAIGADRIATAHHRNDQAETVLLHLLRGTGPQGLGGIPPVRGRYIRPLLQTPREEVEQYNARHGIGHVEDSTNRDLSYGRNRLRLSVWPELEKIHPAVRENIARCAELTRQESEFLDALAARRLPPRGTEIPCAVLLCAPPVLQRRMIRLLMSRLPAGKKDVGAEHIEAAVRLAQAGGVLHLPSGIEVLCRSGIFCLRMEGKAPPPMALTPGENRWGSWTITLSRQRPEGESTALKYGGEPLSVRRWQGTDRLTLPGSRGSRSLKRLFLDSGILPEERDTLPVICLDEQVSYVHKVGLDRRYLPEKTGAGLYVAIKYVGNK